MSALSDIYSALMAAKASNDALETWVRSIDGRDTVRIRAYEIDRGIAADNRLERDLRDGRKHIEPPDDYKLTRCGCGDPGAMPPCSYCTSGIDDEAEQQGKDGE